MPLSVAATSSQLRTYVESFSGWTCAACVDALASTKVKSWVSQVALLPPRTKLACVVVYCKVDNAHSPHDIWITSMKMCAARPTLIAEWRSSVQPRVPG